MNIERLATMVERRKEWCDRVVAELARAYDKHGTEPWGRHEFYAILLEEVDELWAEIKKGGTEPFDREKMEKELIQVAAMTLRYFETGDRYDQPKESNQ